MREFNNLSCLKYEQIDSIIKEIKEYQDFAPVDNEIVGLEEEIVVIVGDSKYPQRTKSVSPTNVKAFGVYIKYGFSEVAFLCDRKTLELYSIIGLFFDSVDKAASLINMLMLNNLMDAFAKYLFYKKQVLLVNANGSISAIDNLLAKFKKHKVMFCWGKKKGYSIRMLKNLNKSKTYNKYDSFIRLKHPSSRSYIHGNEKTSSCYLDRTYKDNRSNLVIQDFKIF